MNVLKKQAARLMAWQAADNADTGENKTDYIRLYSIPFTLLFLVTIISAFFAGYFDFEVLRALEESSGKAPTLFPLLVSIILQVIIYAAGAPVCKVIACKLYKKARHRAVLYFLGGMVIFSISTSVYISTLTRSAERVNLENFASRKKDELLAEKTARNAAALTVLSKIDSSQNADKNSVRQRTTATEQAIKQSHYQNLSAIRQKAEKYKTMAAGWAKVLYKSYTIDSVAAEKRRFSQAIEAARQKAEKHYQGIDQAANKVKSITIAADSVFNAQQAALTNLQLSGAAEDILSAASFKQFRNIMFSILSLFILYALQVYYRQANLLSDNQTEEPTEQEDKDTEPEPEPDKFDQEAAERARQIQLLKDRIRIQYRRSFESATQETRDENAARAGENIRQLFLKFGIDTILNNDKTVIFK